MALLATIEFPSTKEELRLFITKLKRKEEFIGSELTSGETIVIDTRGRKTPHDFLVYIDTVDGKRIKTVMETEILKPISRLNRNNPTLAWEYNEEIHAIHSCQDPRKSWEKLAPKFKDNDDKIIYERILHLLFWLFIEEDINYYGPAKTKIYLGRTMLYGGVQRVFYGDSIEKVKEDWKLK